MWERRSDSLLGLPGKTVGVDGRSPGRALEQEGERAHAGGQGPTGGTPGRRIAAAAEGASQAGWRQCCRGVSGARGAQTRWQLRDIGGLVGLPVSVAWRGKGPTTEDKGILSSELRRELTGILWEGGVGNFKGDLAGAPSLRRV